jgi:hypothetical protein
MMDSLGKQFFAGAAFTRNQYRIGMRWTTMF